MSLANVSTLFTKMEKPFCTEKKEQGIVYYRLLCTEIMEEIVPAQSYSFLVTKMDNGEIIEEVYVFDVTRNQQTAKELFQLLTLHEVMPVHVHDIIEDFWGKV